jgi:ribosomal-protein-alanine N-acetyltransferase
LADGWPLPDLLDVLPLQAGASPEAEPYGVWVVIERSSGTIVGDAGFTGPPAADETIEVGYSIVADRRGRGYATEAVRALVEWALRQPDVTAVVAGCASDNTPSIRVLERVGFMRTDPNGDELRWRLEALAPGQR